MTFRLTEDDWEAYQHERVAGGGERLRSNYHHVCSIEWERPIRLLRLGEHDTVDESHSVK